MDGASAETFLATLCEKRDFEAVRFYEGASVEVSRKPKLALCRAEAFLAVDRLELAREALAPLLLRADAMAHRARALLSDYFERLGRFDGIVELYASAPIDDDPRGLRNLGVAYLRLGRAELLDTLLPQSAPTKTDAWRWVWWLRALNRNSSPSLSQLELEALVAELPASSVSYEVSQLRPLLTQAYRRGQWLGAAKRCTEATEVLENENRALKMARTSVAAAVRGDGSVWEATLSCALKLALLTERPEETCQRFIASKSIGRYAISSPLRPLLILIQASAVGRMLRLETGFSAGNLRLIWGSGHDAGAELASRGHGLDGTRAKHSTERRSCCRCYQY